MAGGARRQSASLYHARSPGTQLGCKQCLKEGLHGPGTAWGAARGGRSGAMGSWAACAGLSVAIGGRHSSGTALLSSLFR